MHHYYRLRVQVLVNLSSDYWSFLLKRFLLNVNVLVGFMLLLERFVVGRVGVVRIDGGFVMSLI